MEGRKENRFFEKENMHFFFFLLQPCMKNTSTKNESWKFESHCAPHSEATKSSPLLIFVRAKVPRYDFATGKLFVLFYPSLLPSSTPAYSSTARKREKACALRGRLIFARTSIHQHARHGIPLGQEASQGGSAFFSSGQFFLTTQRVRILTWPAEQDGRASRNSRILA